MQLSDGRSRHAGRPSPRVLRLSATRLPLHGGSGCTRGHTPAAYGGVVQHAQPQGRMAATQPLGRVYIWMLSLAGPRAGTIMGLFHAL